jgi:hypothetical protein
MADASTLQPHQPKVRKKKKTASTDQRKQAPAKPEIIVELPQNPVPPSEVNPRTMLLYGLHKQGKTTIMSKLPGSHIIFDTEDGTDFLDAMKIKVKDPDTWKAACRAIIKAGRPYKFIVIDTATAIEDFLEDFAWKRYNQEVRRKKAANPGDDEYKYLRKGESIFDVPWGKGHKVYRESFFLLIDWCKKALPEDGYLIITAHLKDKIKSKSGEEVVATDVDLTGKIKEILCRKVDIIGYFYRHEEDPDEGWISFEVGDLVNAGSRCPRLEGESIRISKRKKKKKVDVNWSKVYI